MAPATMRVATLLVFLLVAAVSRVCVTLEVPEVEPGASTESAINETESADDETINAAVRDVAYYLRAHKFNDYDRRYNDAQTSRTLYASFPDPPLRSFHWEVRRSCEPGFDACLRYLHEVALQADLRRADDTATVARSQHWTTQNNSAQIKAVDRECARLRKVDDVGAQPFQGPLERFQWRTTASYYMCWFTMSQIPALTLFGEPCDNFANCLDPRFGISNEDPRADDRLSYQCAAYSFCPDTCCPVRHVTSLSECRDLPVNPCLAESPEDARTCSLRSGENRQLDALALGRWNTSCACARVGFEWDARYGMCVDVDECARATDTCDNATQACFNLAGTFACGCRWGFLWEAREGRCLRAEFLLMPETRFEEVTEKEMSPSLIAAVKKKLFPGKASSSVVVRGLGATLLALVITMALLQPP